MTAHPEGIDVQQKLVGGSGQHIRVVHEQHTMPGQAPRECFAVYFRPVFCRADLGIGDEARLPLNAD